MIKRYDIDYPLVRFLESATGDYCKWVDVYEEIEKYKKVLAQIREECESNRAYAVTICRIENLIENFSVRIA